MSFEAYRTELSAADEITECAQVLGKVCVLGFGLDGSWVDLGRISDFERSWLRF